MDVPCLDLAKRLRRCQATSRLDSLLVNSRHALRVSFISPCSVMRLSPNCLLYAVDSLGAGEIKLVMLATAGIEQGAAIRASVAACHVFLDGHFISASPAEHRGLSPFHPRPDLDRMIG